MIIDNLPVGRFARRTEPASPISIPAQVYSQFTEVPVHIKNFSFYRTPRIHFGAGSIEKIGTSTELFGKKALLLSGSESLQKSGYYEKIVNTLGKSGVELLSFSISEEPSTELVDRAVAMFHDQKIDALISIGGGSVLDAGKAISAMLTLREPVYDYLEGGGGKHHPGTKVPFIAVPTTAGTGSEASANAVITIKGPLGCKRSIRHLNFVPDVAIVDPALTLSCPPSVTAACGMDTLTQLIESYLSKAASPVTDSLVEKALEGFVDALLGAVERGSAIELRNRISYASLISGIALANAGLGVVHGIAPVAGARFPLSHGVLCGLLLAPVTEKNISVLYNENPKSDFLRRYARVAEMVTGKQFKSVEKACDELRIFLFSLTEKFKIPKLSEFGVKEEHLKDIAEKSALKNNPCFLNPSAIEEILIQSL